MKIKNVEKFLYVVLFLVISISLYLYGWVIKSNGDNVEHLHTSWLIWQGGIPYRDFFQHHNPLIWYIFSPLVASLINNINIFNIFNSLSVLTLCGIVFFQNCILKLNGSNIKVRLIYACIVISSFSILNSTDYRPDTFMFLLFFMGIYYLFKYISLPNIKDVVVSFLCFFFSFMCSQKIILNLFIVAIFVFYYIYKGKIKINDFFLALVLPLAIFLFFLTYLYVNDALFIYLKSNYYFNSFIPSIFGNNKTVFPPIEYYEFYIFIPLALISVVFFLKKGSDIERFIAFLFIEEAILRIFYFSAFLHYNLLFLMLGFMLSILFIEKATISKILLFLSSIIYILFSVYYNYQKVYQIKENKQLTNYEYVFNNTTPCDYVINGYYAVYNLKGKNTGYYSILLGQIDVLGEKLGIQKRDDLNNIIIKYKPKIISNNVYWDTYREQRGKKFPIHVIDNELINKYYDYSGYGDLFILKKQYQKRNCQYDGEQWRYID